MENALSWRFVPENRNSEHPVAEDITRVFVGTGIAGMGVASGVVAYTLADAFQRVGAEQYETSLVRAGAFYDAGGAYQVGMVGTEAVLALSAPLFITYGGMLAKRSAQSLMRRIKASPRYVESGLEEFVKGLEEFGRGMKAIPAGFVLAVPFAAAVVIPTGLGFIGAVETWGHDFVHSAMDVAKYPLGAAELVAGGYVSCKLQQLVYGKWCPWVLDRFIDKKSKNKK